MRRRLSVTFSALALVGLSACAGEEGASDAGATDRPDAISGLTVSGEFGEEPTVEVDGLDVEEAVVAELISGDGPEVARDSSVNYRFYIVNDTGELVSNNYPEPRPQSIQVDEQVEVLGDALAGSNIGDRVALAVPVTDLFGPEGGAQFGLAADDDLVIVMDLIEETAEPLTGPEGTEQEAPAGLPTPVEEDGEVTGLDFEDTPRNAPGKLQVVTLVEGEGPEVQVNDAVTVDYLGTVWRGDAPFDESYSGEPTTFTLAEGGLIDGWVEGLQGVPVGSRVMLVVPPEKGYGAAGAGEQIPGGATLVFVVDVLGVNL